MNYEGRVAWIFVAVTLVVAVLAYSPALHGPVLFDDFPNLIDNPPLHIEGWVFDNWRTAATSSDAGPLLRPVAMLSFAVNYFVSGAFTPFSLKLVNLALHIVTAALIYLLALKLFRPPPYFRGSPAGLGSLHSRSPQYGFCIPYTCRQWPMLCSGWPS